MIDPVAVAASVAGVLATVAVIGGALRWIRRRWRVVEDFLDDWRGEAARPGVPERPAVLVRIAAIEGELCRNSGTSLRDAVDRIEHRCDETARGLSDHLAEHAGQRYRLDVTPDHTTLEHGPDQPPS